MKAIRLALMAVFVSVSASAQGTINFSTLGREIRTAPNHTSLGHGGAPDVGDLELAPTTGYLAALYYAPVGVTDMNAFMQVGAPVNFVFPGVIIGGRRTAPVTPPGASVNVQIRVWEVIAGSSWEEAIHRGESTIITVDTGDPTTNPPGDPASLSEIQSFNMYVVPEPSTWTLALLGAGALLMFRRRR